MKNFTILAVIMMMVVVVVVNGCCETTETTEQMWRRGVPLVLQGATVTMANEPSCASHSMYTWSKAMDGSFASVFLRCGYMAGMEMKPEEVSIMLTDDKVSSCTCLDGSGYYESETKGCKEIRINVKYNDPLLRGRKTTQTTGVLCDKPAPATYDEIGRALGIYQKLGD